ncbi:C-GCAxxG-C-C family protein [Selenomonas sputigena]|uniref:C-GCAxxG-C-C family protein n=1 Tax=Selenomonas sputigena TaxID=69823 RepID=A0ABV3X675_9FIRM
MDHMEETRTLRNEPGGRHYNCAQSLLVPFAPEIGIEKDAANDIGSFLGGGMMHGSACGTLSAALIILGKAGMEKDTAENLLQEFLNAHGTTDCKALLSLAATKGISRKENCDGLVYDMCQKLDKLLG